MALPTSGPIGARDFNIEFSRDATSQLRFGQMYRGGPFVPANNLNITGWNIVFSQPTEPVNGGIPQPGTGVVTNLLLINPGRIPSNTSTFSFSALSGSGRALDLNITLGGSGNNGFVQSFFITDGGFGFAVNDIIRGGFLVPGPGGFTSPEWRVTSVNTPPVIPVPEFAYANSLGFGPFPPGGDFFWAIDRNSGRVSVCWQSNFFQRTADFTVGDTLSLPNINSTVGFGTGNFPDPFDFYRYERGPLELSSGGIEYYRLKRRPVTPRGTNTPVNTGVPSNGQIGFSNMRGAQDF